MSQPRSRRMAHIEAQPGATAAASSTQSLYMGTAIDGRILISVRESNAYDLMAFATMIRQILEPLVHIPGVEEVLTLTATDATVMRSTSEGERLRQRWGARPLYQDNRPYGYVFTVEETTFFFAMTSAMSSDSEDLSNSFTDDLISELERIRPAHLFSGPGTRLVRREDLGHRLGRTCKQLAISVHIKEHPRGLNLNGADSMAWTVLCMVAEQDLRMTVMRLVTGRIFATRRNAWEKGQGSMLLGYAIEETTNKPILGNDLSQHLGRLSIQLAAAAWDEEQQILTTDADRTTRRFTPESIIQKLSDDGATKRSAKKKDKYGRAICGSPLESVTNAKAALCSILKDLPTYRTGMLQRTQGLPLTRLTQHDVHGMTIYKDRPNDPEDKGYVIFEWEFPMPIEGWASPDVLEKAERYLDLLESKDGREPPRPEVAWPLSGVFAAAHNETDDWFRLVFGSGGYQWRRFPANNGYAKNKSVAVGKFSAKDLHEAFVEAILRKLEDTGVSAESVLLPLSASTNAPTRSETHEEKSAALQNRISKTEALYEQARTNANEATSSRAQQDYRSDADRYAVILDELNSKLIAIDQEVVTKDQELEPQPLELGTLATLLSLLLDCTDAPAPPTIHDLLAKFIADGTIIDCWSDDAPWATFRFFLRLPSKRGTSVIGPIDFRLGNTSQGPDRKAFLRRLQRVLRLRMTTDVTIDDLASQLGQTPTPARVSKNIMDAMRMYLPAKNVASAAVDCPITSTRHAIFSLVSNERLPPTIGDLNEEETTRFIEHLRDTYLDPNLQWAVPAWSRGGERSRREIARWIGTHLNSANKLEGVSRLELCKVMGWNNATTTDRHVRRTPGIPSVIEKGDVPGNVRLRQCPWCEIPTLSQPLPCPELGDDPVLCAHCRRCPSDPSLVFPSEYLLPWEGPTGRTITDDRASRPDGEHRGTRLGNSPTMPSAARVRRAVTKPGRGALPSTNTN